MHRTARREFEHATHYTDRMHGLICLHESEERFRPHAFRATQAAAEIQRRRPLRSTPARSTPITRLRTKCTFTRAEILQRHSARLVIGYFLVA